MIAQIVTTLAIVCLSLSVNGLNLRAETTALVEDQAAGARAIRSFLKTNAKERRATHKALAEEKNQYFSAGNQNSKAFYVQLQDTTIEHGYLVSRSRPNGDCSGIVKAMTAQSGECRFSEDETGSVTSEWISCTRKRKGQEVVLTRHRYHSNDCSGMPYETSDKQMNKCFFDVDAAPDEAQMMNVQCVAQNELPGPDQGGVMFNTFFDGGCSAQPDGYALARFGGCELTYTFFDDAGNPTDEEIFNWRTTYNYQRLENCDGTKLKFSFYSDPACTRRVSHFWADAADALPYGRCEWNDDQERFTSVMCVPAPHK